MKELSILFLNGDRTKRLSILLLTSEEIEDLLLYSRVEVIQRGITTNGSDKLASIQNYEWIIVDRKFIYSLVLALNIFSRSHDLTHIII